MSKIRTYPYGKCLLASIIVNIFFITNWYNGRNNEVSWSRGAAEEAEAVAGISCSDHGRAYVDGVASDGKPVCECNTCFQGPDCSQFIPDCPADAASPFGCNMLLVAGWHRMSYIFPDHSYVSKELVSHIRRVHAIAKNAVTDGKYIIFGCGSTQLITAAVFALSSQNSSSPSRVVASSPFYPLYKTQTDYFRTADFQFEGDTSSMKNNSDAINLIEFVTSPNNPDGRLKKAVLHGPFVKSIHDHAYYWPHFTAIPTPADEDFMIFTLSKLTGHAGSRFGWAIIKDEGVYQKMVEYMEQEDSGVSRDTQLRALKLFKSILTEGNGREMFHFGYTTMVARWIRLNQIISLSKQFRLQELSPQHCNFLNRVRDPSPAYAWLKCVNEEDADCAKVLRAANIIGRAGNMYNVENYHVRLSLLRSQDDFELLLHRMRELVIKEVSAAQAM